MKATAIKLCLALIIFPLLLICCVQAEYSFLLIDNFENGALEKWYQFGNLQMAVQKKATPEGESKDTIADSCGDYVLNLKGSANNWYAGGVGKTIMADASPFSRLQLDVSGGSQRGKIKIELFTDGSGGQLPSRENKWVAEIPILGEGVTRISVPFTAFKLDNPTGSHDVWRADQKDGAQGLLRLQFILLTDQQTGEVEASVDNILLTY